MRTLKLLGLITALVLSASLAKADPVALDSGGDVWTYVGSFNVQDGPYWAAFNGVEYTTPVYSGLEAATTVFGAPGAGYVYATSIVSNFVSHTAWYDGWGIHPAGGTEWAEDFHYDADNDGRYATPFGTGNAWSAFVSDGIQATNYVFVRQANVANTPDTSSTLALFGAVSVTLMLARRQRRAA